MTQHITAELRRIEPFTVDEDTVQAIRRIRGLALVPHAVLALVLVVGACWALFARGADQSMLYLGLALLSCAVGIGVYNRVILKPVAAVRYAARVKAIIATMPVLGVTPTMLHSWRSPTPGAMALDRTRSLLFLQSDGTGHARLVLRPEHIIGVKVERETELHTRGRPGVFSTSKTTAVHQSFLEVHYQLDAQSASGWLVIPFGAERQAADAMAAAIQHMQPQRR